MMQRNSKTHNSKEVITMKVKTDLKAGKHHPTPTVANR
jgi:hypothetical protein